MEQDRTLAGRRVLVAEDEGLIALQIADLLESWGCVVCGPVPTKLAALELVQRELLDAAILDFELRDGTSVLVAEQLTARGVPYVLISASSTEHVPAEMRRAAGLRKPLNDAKLRAWLADAVRP